MTQQQVKLTSIHVALLMSIILVSTGIVLCFIVLMARALR